MTRPHPKFRTKLAATEHDIIAAQRLRYDVFVDEMGSDGDLVDHKNRLERDIYDPYFDHILLIDDARITAQGAPSVVGVYRVLTDVKARELGRFYSADEYDLTPLITSGRRLLELGRSCLHPDYRGGTAMHVLWQALADYIDAHQIEVLFGVASFHGTDIDALAPALSLLYAKHRAPEPLCPVAIGAAARRMDLIPYDAIDRKAAMVMIPSLIKAYLRLGGMVGQGAYIDHGFNTTDVCLVLDTQNMNDRQRKIYERRA